MAWCSPSSSPSQSVAARRRGAPWHEDQGVFSTKSPATPIQILSRMDFSRFYQVVPPATMTAFIWCGEHNSNFTMVFVGDISNQFSWDYKQTNITWGAPPNVWAFHNKPTWITGQVWGSDQKNAVQNCLCRSLIIDSPMKNMVISMVILVYQKVS
jgi:hypothetical protein